MYEDGCICCDEFLASVSIVYVIFYGGNLLGVILGWVGSYTLVQYIC